MPMCFRINPKKGISKLIQHNVKYEELLSVFLLNAAYGDKTFKALI